MLYATIVLNDAAHDRSVDDSGERDHLDVQSVVTALVGEVIGLSRPVDDADSIMDGSYDYDDGSKRVLGDADLAGIWYLYPDPSCPSPPELERICCDSATDCEGCEDIGSVTCDP